jgi:hypothetical protein
MVKSEGTSEHPRMPAGGESREEPRDTGKSDEHLERLERARKIVRNKLGFIKHFIVYVLVLIALTILNNLTSGGYQWWLWIAFGWGIGVIAHFLSAYIFQGGDLEERLVRRELERMEKTDEQELD